MRPVLFLLAAAFYQLGASQSTFERLYGFATGVTCTGLEVCSDSGFAMVGMDIATNGPAFLIRTDANGDTLWTRHFSTGPDDQLFGIAETANADLVVLGTTGLIKVDANGALLWSKVYSTWEDHALDLTSDGGFLVGGWSSSVVRLDSMGDPMWAHYSGVGNQNAILETIDGGYITVGDVLLAPGNLDLHIAKVSSSGVVEWSKLYGGTEHDVGTAVAATQSGGYIVCGTAYSFTSGSGDLWLLEIDGTGTVLWSRVYEGPPTTYGFSVEALPDGGFLAAGGMQINGNHVVRVDATGNLIWSRSYGDQASSWTFSRRIFDGGYVVAGTANNFGHIYLAKTDSAGGSACSVDVPLTVIPVVPDTMSYPMQLVTSVPTVSNLPVTITAGGLVLNACSGLSALERPDMAGPSITPNPSHGRFNVLLNDNEVRSVQVHDAQGRVVTQQAVVSGTVAIDLTDRADGMYVVRLIGSGRHYALHAMVLH